MRQAHRVLNSLSFARLSSGLATNWTQRMSWGKVPHHLLSGDSRCCQKDFWNQAPLSACPRWLLGTLAGKRTQKRSKRASHLDTSSESLGGSLLTGHMNIALLQEPEKTDVIEHITYQPAEQSLSAGAPLCTMV